jgi:plastocyanin
MKLFSRRGATRVPAVLALALVLALAGSAIAAARTLSGTVGSGFTITLKSGSKKVSSVKHGKYTIAVRDKSDIHDFHLVGPGVNKKITTVGFKGTKSVSVTLKKGTYKYFCDPHKSDMHGSFKVK